MPDRRERAARVASRRLRRLPLPGPCRRRDEPKRDGATAPSRPAAADRLRFPRRARLRSAVHFRRTFLVLLLPRRTLLPAGREGARHSRHIGDGGRRGLCRGPRARITARDGGATRTHGSPVGRRPGESARQGRSGTRAEDPRRTGTQAGGRGDAHPGPHAHGTHRRGALDLQQAAGGRHRRRTPQPRRSRRHDSRTAGPGDPGPRSGVDGRPRRGFGPAPVAGPVPEVRRPVCRARHSTPHPRGLGRVVHRGRAQCPRRSRTRPAPRRSVRLRPPPAPGLQRGPGPGDPAQLPP